MSEGYLFDTNAVSELLRPRPDPGYVAWVASLPLIAQTVSSITIGELFRGAYRTRAAARHLENLRTRVLPNTTVLPFDAETAEIYGRLCAALWDAGSPVEDFDLMIGATAIQHDLCVVTANVKDFARIPGLHVHAILQDRA